MDDLSRKARGLAAAIEPYAGQVYFSPECHANYTALGFTASAGIVRSSGSQLIHTRSRK